jgi:hypothetical protein
MSVNVCAPVRALALYLVLTNIGHKESRGTLVQTPHQETFSEQ